MAEAFAPKVGSDIFVESPVADTSLGDTFSALSNIGNSYLKSKSAGDGTSAVQRTKAAFFNRMQEIESMNLTPAKRMAATRQAIGSSGLDMDQLNDSYMAATGRPLALSTYDTGAMMMDQLAKDPMAAGYMALARANLPEGASQDQVLETATTIFADSKMQLATEQFNATQTSKTISALKTTVSAAVVQTLDNIEAAGGSTNITDQDVQNFFGPILNTIDRQLAAIDPNDKENASEMKQYRDNIVSVMNTHLGAAYDTPTAKALGKIERSIFLNPDLSPKEVSARVLFMNTLKSERVDWAALEAIGFGGLNRADWGVMFKKITEDATDVGGVEPIYQNSTPGTEDPEALKLATNIAITNPKNPGQVMTSMKSAQSILLQMQAPETHLPHTSFVGLFGNPQFMKNLEAFYEQEGGELVIQNAVRALDRQEAVYLEEGNAIAKEHFLSIDEGKISINEEAFLSQFGGEQRQRAENLLKAINREGFENALENGFRNYRTSFSQFAAYTGRWARIAGDGGDLRKLRTGATRIGSLRKWRDQIKSKFSQEYPADPKRVG